LIKRFFDIVFSFCGLLIFSPVLLTFIFLIWINDKGNPLYSASRVGKDNKTFRMIKLRSMVLNADKTGVNSTSSNDNRITPIGAIIRKYKLDELMQLWNVLTGDMSLVGPRPNVESETRNYTKVEKKLLSEKPGITDFASIVFSDEGEILKNSSNPDLDYNRLIRPWKSRLGIFYTENKSVMIDLKIIFFTVVAIFKKQLAINWVVEQLKSFNCDEKLINVASRKEPLKPSKPPGSNKIPE